MATLYRTGYMLFSLAHPDGAISDQGKRVELEEIIWDNAVQGSDLCTNIINLIQSDIEYANTSVFLQWYSILARNDGDVCDVLGESLKNTKIWGDSKCM